MRQRGCRRTKIAFAAGYLVGRCRNHPSFCCWVRHLFLRRSTKYSRTPFLSQPAYFKAGIADLQNRDPASAAQEFSSLPRRADGLGTFAQWLSFLFQGGAGTVTAFMDVDETARPTFHKSLRTLEGDVFQLLSGANGS